MALFSVKAVLENYLLFPIAFLQSCQKSVFRNLPMFLILGIAINDSVDFAQTLFCTHNACDRNFTCSLSLWGTIKPSFLSFLNVFFIMTVTVRVRFILYFCDSEPKSGSSLCPLFSFVFYFNLSEHQYLSLWYLSSRKNQAVANSLRK